MADFPNEYRDLLDAQFATLATVEPDGTPQLSEIWFLQDDGEIRLSLNTRATSASSSRSSPRGSGPST